jgi:hypothetical protein
MTEPARRKKVSSPSPRVTKRLHPTSFIRDRFSTSVQAIAAHRRAFMMRRPHRSFRLTARRDAGRQLLLPGYVAFTLEVGRALRTHARTFLSMTIVYSIAIVLLGGVTSQDTYDTINGLLAESSGELFAGGAGKLKEAGLLLVSSFGSGPATLAADQQVYLSMVLLLIWLSVVWLHREFLIGRRPRFRDGLYNSSAPFVSTLLVGITILVQLVPLGIVALAYDALSGAGVISDGFGSMLFWVFASAAFALILYWVTSSIMALVVVTLPGMYPLRALKIAGDLVVGRRLRILYRLIWGAGITVFAWITILVPLVLLDAWLKQTWQQLAGVPAVPTGVAVMSTLSAIWYASYVYLLYRRIVDDDAKPA